MNPRPLSFSNAIEGFLQAKAAEALSPRTISSYEHILKQWLTFAGDHNVMATQPAQIRQYLAYLRTDYVPSRFNGKTHKLSGKSLRNVYIVLRSFFGWLQREFEMPSPMSVIPAPSFEVADVVPFSQDDIVALLKTAEYCRETVPGNRRRFVMRRRTGLRDRSLILVLLDTGLRASELCGLNVGDYDPKTGQVKVKHGFEGGSKGGKGRLVYLGKAARHALWRFLAEREDGQDPEAPLYVSQQNRRMTRDALRQLIDSLGEKADVKNCYPHRFRHTFAITFLRSGGDVYSLQRLLGHSTLEMSQHYARLAQVDIEQAHRRASPVDNWRL